MNLTTNKMLSLSLLFNGKINLGQLVHYAYAKCLGRVTVMN